MKYSTFSITLPDWRHEEGAKNLKEIGYDGVAWRIADQEESDVPGFWIGNRSTWRVTGLEESLPEFKRIRDVSGLEISALYGYPGWNDKVSLKRHFAAAAELGVKACRVLGPGQPTKSAPRPQLGMARYNVLFEQSRSDLRWVADCARDFGVRAVSPLHQEWVNSSASAARRLLDGLDPSAVGVIIDWGHLVREGWEDPVATIEILGEYLDSVMLKNYGLYPTRERSDGTIVWGVRPETLRKGRVDVHNVMAALNATGFDGWVTLAETSGDLSTRDRLADALAYVKAADQATKNAKLEEWRYEYTPMGGEWSGLPDGERLQAD